jgi:hypothetical protein
MTNDTTAASKDQTGNITPHIHLIYQALETEMGGVEIYTTALECVQNEELREEWEEYLEQTRGHVKILRGVCSRLGLDPDRETPGRLVVRTIGKSLVKAMQLAIGAGDPKTADITAGECVTLAETKDHGNWVLMGILAESSTGTQKEVLKEAADAIEDQEDEHLYHTAGWTRELWLDFLGLTAQLPPPEEKQDVHSEEEAIKAKSEGGTGSSSLSGDRHDGPQKEQAVTSSTNF